MILRYIDLLQVICKNAIDIEGESAHQEIDEGFKSDRAVVLYQLVVNISHVFILIVQWFDEQRSYAVYDALTEYTRPWLARAALVSVKLNVLVSSRSKYRNVLSNCSSCAGVRLVMFRETICPAFSQVGCAERDADLIVNKRYLLRKALRHKS